MDWACANIESIVKDAVERRRIHAILKKHYRVLFHLFRYHASTNVNDPFRLTLTSKANLLEHLKVRVAEQHGVHNTNRMSSITLLITQLI